MNSPNADESRDLVNRVLALMWALLFPPPPLHAAQQQQTVPSSTAAATATATPSSSASSASLSAVPLSSTSASASSSSSSSSSASSATSAADRLRADRCAHEAAEDALLAIPLHLVYRRRSQHALEALRYAVYCCCRSEIGNSP